MGWIARFYRSTIGRKIVMAATGIVLVVYLLGHVAGNLLVFRGPQAINDYAHFLQSSAALLWSVRTILILSLGLHVQSAWTLSRDARAARPQSYRRLENQASGWPARSMGWGGVLLFLFIVYHILHFTTGTVHPSFVPGEVYDNVGGRLPRSCRGDASICSPMIRAGPPFAARHLEHLSDAGREPSARESAAPPAGGPARAADPGRPRCDSAGHRARPLSSGPRPWSSTPGFPAGPLEKKWDTPSLRAEAGQPGQQAQVHASSWWAPAWPAPRRPRRSASWATTCTCFCFQDSPRRAHSIAAQGGINAAKNYQNDGDSIYRLFYDTIKGGDFRAREANVYRLAQVSVNIIDQCVAQGVPFAREYGGLLANRSFGGAQVSRTFYARGQTGPAAPARRLPGAVRGRSAAGIGHDVPRTEMLDLVVVDGQRAGHRRPRSGHRRRSSPIAGDAVVLATGGYGNVFYLSTNAKGCNVTATWRAYKRGAGFANPCYTQIHPTCIPVSGDYQSKLTLMSESLRNDGRVWVPKAGGDKRAPGEIPEERAGLLSRAEVSELRQSGAARHRVARGQGGVRRGPGRRSRPDAASTSTSPTRSAGWERTRFASGTATCSTCTSGSPARTPTACRCASIPRRALHDGRALGGLQPHEHDPGPVRAGRGQLLRSRRQPARAPAR